MARMGRAESWKAPLTTAVCGPWCTVPTHLQPLAAMMLSWTAEYACCQVAPVGVTREGRGVSASGRHRRAGVRPTGEILGCNVHTHAHAHTHAHTWVQRLQAGAAPTCRTTSHAPADRKPSRLSR